MLFDRLSEWWKRLLLLFALTLLLLLRCPFGDFFGSLASRDFPLYLSFPSEGRGAF